MFSSGEISRMSRSGLTQVTPAYQPATGIISDFENLFRQFEALKSVRYTQFLQIWKQMQMSFIFAGRQTDRECREVSTFFVLQIRKKEKHDKYWQIMRTVFQIMR